MFVVTKYLARRRESTHFYLTKINRVEEINCWVQSLCLIDTTNRFGKLLHSAFIIIIIIIVVVVVVNIKLADL